MTDIPGRAGPRPSVDAQASRGVQVGNDNNQVNLFFDTHVETQVVQGAPVPDAMSLAGARMVRHEIARRLNEEPGRDLFVTSQMQALWRAFSETDWRVDCKHEARMLSAFCCAEPTMGDLAARISAIDWEGTFEVLWSTLRELPLRPAIERLAAQAARVRADDNDRRRHYADARAHARWLRDQAERPRFRRCLPVLGSWGAGKTRLLVEIARAQLDQAELAVFLGSDFTGSLREELLRKSGELLGWQPSDLASLRRVLDDDLHTRLFVLFDDAGAAARRPDLLGALQGLISECTRTDAIRWVVTADVLHFDSLTSAEHASFWTRYGYQPRRGEPRSIGGWLDLDAINADEQVGLQLLESASDDQDRADIAEIRRDVVNFDYEARSLCNPLPAWLRLEIADDEVHTDLLNVYLARFVSAYWERRKATLATGSGQAEEFDALVTLLARRLATAPGSAVKVDEVLADAISLPRLSREVIVRDIDALVAGGILNSRTVGDVLVDLPTEEIRPRLEVFWGYRIAKVLLGQISYEDKTAIHIFDTLRPWGLSVATGDWVAEAVIEFGLALLPWQGSEAALTRAVWESWYRDADLPSHPLWLAGVSIPGFAQKRIRDWLKRSPPEITGKRELFLLLRLLALAASSEWQAQQRLGAICSHYRLIGDNGLGMYFAHVVSMLLDRRDITSAKNYETVLTALAGSEDAGVASLVADIAVQAGWALFGSDVIELLANVVTFLRRSAVAAHMEAFPRHPRPGMPAAVDEAPADPNSTPAHFFWQHLIRATCRSLVEHFGVEAFGLLAESHWFSGSEDIASYVGFRMQQEANVALGASFRGRHESDPVAADKFLALVGALAHGRALDLPLLKQQEIAFFLIRHTTVTRGRPAVLVDESLWPILRTLCHNERFRARMRSSTSIATTATCALNGCSECKRNAGLHPEQS